MNDDGGFSVVSGPSYRLAMGWQEKFDESDQGGSPTGIDYSASNYSDSNSEVSGVEAVRLPSEGKRKGNGEGKLPAMAHVGAAVPFIDFLGVGAT